MPTEPPRNSDAPAPRTAGRIRVLHVIATLDPHGAERQLAALCAGLDKRRFEVRVVCLTREGPLRAQLEAAGVPVSCLRKRGRFDAGVFFRLAAAVRRFRPHVVHTWLFTSNLWGRLAARAAGAPCIVASERAADRWKTRAHFWLDRRLAALTDVVLANSEAVREFCVERAGVPARKVLVIRNGIDLARFYSAMKRGPSAPLPVADGPVVGVVARLEEQKGHEHLLRAFAMLLQGGRRADLWLVGDGPLRPRLEALAEGLGIASRVKFLGTRPDVPALLARMDVLALPSLWEGLPNAVVEAMAAGLPVAATDVDGTPEVAVDGRTALLVPPRAPAALGQALATLLDDPALRRSMGRAGRERAEQKFAMERMINETGRLYEKLAMAKGAYPRATPKPRRGRDKTG